MEFKDLIKTRRLEIGKTLEEVSKEVGVSKATVQRWESGEIANMRRDKIAKLAKALETTPAYLMGWTEEPLDILSLENILPLGNTTKIPLLGEIACGEPITAEENIEQYIDMEKEIHADFALRCKGDSMINARIFNGDIVYIRQQPKVENGEIAAVLIENEATLKRVYYYDNRIELRPENPLFSVLNYEGETLKEIRILGKAVAFLSKVY